jgi:aryl-alcohol dehydrogenase-like predicted oxidoreductase
MRRRGDLDQKPLGKTGETISGIGLGCVTFGREIDEEQSYRIMDYAVEKGITFFDTAEGYGGGNAREGRLATGIDDVREMTAEVSSSERIIGTWIKANGIRDQITICTKVGSGGSPENVKAKLAASLDRLQIDRTDVYKMHSPDESVPIAETLGALDAEVRAGLVGCIGGSNYDGAQVQEALDASAAHGYARFEITQPIYNLAHPEHAVDLFPICEKEEIAVTPYSPLGAGFLAGKYTRGDRQAIPTRTRFDTAPGHIDVYFSDRNFNVVEALQAKSKEIGVSMVKLAMAWAMTHSAVTAVLVGARETRHIDNALEAYDMGLDPGLRSEMSAWD